MATQQKYRPFYGALKELIITYSITFCRFQWPRVLRCRSAAARLLILWVRIPPGSWMSVCCECCVLSGRGLCDGLITRPEEPYRLWCVVVCDLETSWMGRPLGGCRAKERKNCHSLRKFDINILYEVKNSLFVSLLRTSLNEMHINSECTTHKSICKQTGLCVNLV